MCIFYSSNNKLIVPSSILFRTSFHSYIFPFDRIKTGLLDTSTVKTDSDKNVRNCVTQAIVVIGKLELSNGTWSELIQAIKQLGSQDGEPVERELSLYVPEITKDMLHMGEGAITVY